MRKKRKDVRLVKGLPALSACGSLRFSVAIGCVSYLEEILFAVQLK